MRKSIYDPHPGIEMRDPSIARLSRDTGRTLSEWVETVERLGPAGAKERAQWLKERFGLKNADAAWIAERSSGRRLGYDPAVLVRQMLAHHPNLQPAYDRLIACAIALGGDVTAVPASRSVSLWRNSVFAEIRPVGGHLELGLLLGDVPAEPRLVPAGPRERLTHRTALSKVDEVDEDVGRWLRIAYQRDGERTQ